MHPIRWLTPVVTLSLSLGIPAVATATPPKTRPQSTEAVVTLITGDRVRVTSTPGQPDRTTFVPGPGSRSDAALTSSLNGRTYVVPIAAQPDVLAGRLDRSLFDVRTLIAEGATESTPVIIRYAGAAKTALGRARSAVPGTQGGRVLNSLGARATRVSAGTSFWKSVDKTARISLDRRVQASLDQSVPQIGGPAAWQRGLTGKGVKLAVLDTGIDPTHPDLAGRIAAAENFSTAEDANDHHGHGTHVASIAAGAGAKHRGVAPEATLLSGKVLNDNGQGYDSGIIAGMEWAVAQGAKVVNLSLGGDATDGTDELSQAVNRISTESGALFVVAAGNVRPPDTSCRISTPAAADQALAVGNLLRDGKTSERSCRGPRLGDNVAKPELSAPGTGIVAARAAGTSLGEPVDDHYTAASGTSMAGPHAAGTAALIAQAHPQWTADALKARLISTADPQPNNPLTGQGAGRVDADQATAADPSVDIAELDLGTITWPYPQTDPVTRELKYRNPTTAPVTLSLASDLPAVRFSAPTIVVPANGEAVVTVTADRAAAGSGPIAGRITATPTGADPLVTVIGWYAEPEMYDVTVTGIGRTGEPADGELGLNRLDGEQPNLENPQLVDGTAKVRLAPGRYDLSSIFLTDATDATPGRFDLVLSEEFEVRRPTSLTLDARKTQPLDLGVQGQNVATARTTEMSFVREVPGVRRTNGASASGARRTFAATRTAAPTVGSTEIALGKRLEQPPYLAQIVGGPAFTALDFHTGPRFTGQKDLRVSDGGAGSPAELTGVKGKLALIRTDGSRPSGELAKNAQDAGAAAVMLYRPDRAGDGAMFSFWALGENGEATLPTMRISRVSAQALLKGSATVRVTGQAVTPYVYDLVVPWRDRIPAESTVTVRPEELATIEETFGAHVRGARQSESRSGTTPAGATLNTFLPPDFPTPSKRTAYVLGNGVQWSSVVSFEGGTTMHLTNTPRTYRPGAKSVERWMTGVLTSGLPDGPSGPATQVGRMEGGLGLSFSALGRGSQYLPHIYAGGEIKVSRNGREIANEPGIGVLVDVPADAATYAVDLVAASDPDVFRYSSSVESHWKFRSKGGADEVMPLVLADLDVPQSDGLNRVPTGRAVTIDIGLRHQFGSGSTAAFAKPKLEISYDGRRWTALPVTGSGAKYAATVTHPASAVGKTPSLRVTANDAVGNSLKQVITAAYGLK